MSLQGQFPAVCHRCGAHKQGPLVPCKGCGFIPTREARAVAWLFSAHHLEPEELAEAARRLRVGSIPDPPRALRVRAQRAMGALDAPPEADRPLEPSMVVLLVLGEVIFTPLVGLAVWLGCRESRPRAARVAWYTMWPVTVLLALLWCIDRWGPVG